MAPRSGKPRQRKNNHTRARRNAVRSNRINILDTSKSKAKANIQAKADRCKRFIYNYSDYQLSAMQTIALSKGFKFIPTCKRPPRMNILNEFHQLARKMRMKYIMRNKLSKQPLFKLKSTWDPRSSDNIALEEYLDETKLELSKLKRLHPKDNMSKAERVAIAQLKKNSGIVVKPLDKGKACAVVSREQYVQEAQRQLSAFQYQKIDGDMTNETAIMADDIVEELFDGKYIDKHTREYLLSKNNDIDVPSLYLLVKAHKAKPENSAFCGRPIISGCCSPTKALSEYLDYFLLPLVQGQDTYLKDSPELIKILADLKLPPDTILVTADVTSLYTNIPQDDCVDIVVDRLEKSHIRYDIPKPPSDLVRRILHLILKRNCFEFNNEFYLQIVGAAQGNIVSPEISDLVMYALEKDFILTDPNIIFYRRYRDDLLLFYKGSHDELLALKSRMNHAHPTLKFIFEISDQLVTYLDLQIFKGDRFLEQGLLDHRINMKKTETHQWLSPDSAHCPNVFKALVLGETIRYCRGHTSEQDFITKVKFFTDKLVERGYDRSQINDTTNQVKFEQRDNYLKTKPPIINGTEKRNIPLVLVTPYTPFIRTQDLKTAVTKHWQKIANNPTLNKLFPQPPLLAFKREKNLADILVKSKLPRLDEPALKTKPDTPLDTPREAAPLTDPLLPKRDNVEVEWGENEDDLLRCLIELMHE